MRAHSFSAASRDASISQAALSEQIALLESTLDVQLFDRASGRAVATASGHELDRRVSACLSELQALRDVQARASTVAGLVRIGLVQSYAGCWVLPVVRRAQAQWPQLAIALRRRTAQALVEGVLRGDFDLAVSFDPEPHADLEILACFDEPVVAVGLKPAGGDACWSSARSRTTPGLAAKRIRHAPPTRQRLCGAGAEAGRASGVRYAGGPGACRP